MARLAEDRLSSPDDLHLEALVGDTETDRLISGIVEVLRRADSHEGRLALMRTIDFPIQDVPAFLVVSHLSLYGSLRPSELADRLEMGAANITKIVGRLELQGLVGRTADPKDGRSVIVALTDSGREVGERLVRSHRSSMTAWVKRWTPEEIDLFYRVLMDFSAFVSGGPQVDD